MVTKLQKLTNQHADLRTQMEEILTAAETTPSGRLTEAQQGQYDNLKALSVTLEESIQRERAAIGAEGRIPAVRSIRGDGSVVHVASRERDGGLHGFSDPLEYLRSVMAAGTPGASIDPRLAPLARQDEIGAGFGVPRGVLPSGLRAAVGSDEHGLYDDSRGGFLAPSTLGPLRTLAAEGDPTAPYVSQVPMRTGTVKIPARTDKDHTTSVSGGFIVSRKGETVAASLTRSQMELVKLEAHAQVAATAATWDLIAEVPEFVPLIIQKGMQDEFGTTKLREKLRGGGGDQYLGVLTALASTGLGPTIAVARTTSSRIKGEDIMGMRSRCWGYENGIWLANPDAYSDIATAVIIATDGGATPVGGIAVRAFQSSMAEGRPDMLLGRPIYWTEYASTLGAAGDLILGVWSEYLEGIYLPLESRESMHVRFLEREQTFLFWEKNCGAPWWRTPLTPNQSTDTLSPFVIIAA